MHKDNKNYVLLHSLGIPYFEDLDEFAALTGLSTRLIFLLSTYTENYYTSKQIPKRNGDMRTIYIPSYTIKILQKWILVNIINKLQPSQYAMAFIKYQSAEFKHGIKANAIYHSSSLYGLSIDLCNFFPSIKSNKVYQLFKNIGYNNFASTLLTRLCTLNGELPQGAVCSPALSNLICINLDIRLSGLCSKRRILYTRYADDMYFSCDNKVLLLKIYPVIENIIIDEGFEINRRKCHYHTPKNTKLITGVTVVQREDKSELKASKELKRKIRSEIFRCIMTGSYDDSDHIRGEIAYVEYIQKENKNGYRASIINYINKITEKIVYFPELVDAYNANLFFNELSPRKFKPICDLQLEMDKSDENYDDTLFCKIVGLYQERIEYLKRHNLHDVCQYEGWPDFSLSNESL